MVADMEVGQQEAVTHVGLLYLTLLHGGAVRHQVASLCAAVRLRGGVGPLEGAEDVGEAGGGRRVGEVAGGCRSAVQQEGQAALVAGHHASGSTECAAS